MYFWTSDLLFWISRQIKNKIGFKNVADNCLFGGKKEYQRKLLVKTHYYNKFVIIYFGIDASGAICYSIFKLRAFFSNVARVVCKFLGT